MEKGKKLLDKAELKLIVRRIASQIIERNKGIEDVVLIGIKRRGDIIAERLRAELENMTGKKPLIGAIDITLYRDDLDRIAETPIVKGTHIPFDITDKIVVLVDDVLFTGRTVRAALTEILDYGRPKKIQLAILIDRMAREIPIGADFIGKKIPASKDAIIDVFLNEFDGKEGVFLREKK